MKISELNELHFIAYISNIPSIQKNGILSRNEVKRRKISFKDISEQGVQDIRANKKIPGTAKFLHDYANLYFDAHNPMLSRRRSDNDEICVLRINRDVINVDGVIVTDQNAARECWFMPVMEGIALLDKEDLYRVSWKDRNDSFNEYRQAGAKCAEILVPDCVKSGYIIGAYAANKTALDQLKGICQFPSQINTDLFFYGGY